MSAYDMKFSDAIYGVGDRYVCEDRLMRMFDHEYVLLPERLPHRIETTRFFAFADTVEILISNGLIKAMDGSDFVFSFALRGSQMIA